MSIAVPARPEDDDTFDLERWRAQFQQALRTFEAAYQSDMADRQNNEQPFTPDDVGVFLTDLHIAETCISQLRWLSEWRGPRVLNMIAEASAWGWLRATALARVAGGAIEQRQGPTAQRHRLAAQLEAIIPPRATPWDEPQTGNPSDELRRAIDTVHHAYGEMDGSDPIPGPYHGLDEVVDVVARLAGHRLRRVGPTTIENVASASAENQAVLCRVRRRGPQPWDPPYDDAARWLWELRDDDAPHEPTEEDILDQFAEKYGRRASRSTYFEWARRHRDAGRAWPAPRPTGD